MAVLLILSDVGSSLLIITLAIPESAEQLLKQDMTITQILRTYGKQFTQIQMRYFDGQEGKYAIGVIGW